MSGIPLLNEKGDISGWSSLFISTAVGIYITFAILIYSDISQNKMETFLSDMQKFRDDRRIVAERFLRIGLEQLEKNIKQIDHERIQNKGKLTAEKIKKRHEIDSILAMYNQEKLLLLTNMYATDLGPEQITYIPEIVMNTKDFVNAPDETYYDWGEGQKILVWIRETLLSIPEYAKQHPDMEKHTKILSN
ncbi:MAG: hypothetical protein ABI342_09800 [Nitrososphaera sp.]